MCISVYMHICIFVYLYIVLWCIYYVFLTSTFYSTRRYAQYGQCNILCTVAVCICWEPWQRVQKKSASQQLTCGTRSIAARALSSCTRCAPSAALFPQSAFESFWQLQIDTMFKMRDKCRSTMHYFQPLAHPRPECEHLNLLDRAKLFGRVRL